MSHEKYDHNEVREILIEAIEEAVGHIRLVSCLIKVGGDFSSSGRGGGEELFCIK